jgi:hypothetical protein
MTVVRSSIFLLLLLQVAFSTAQAADGSASSFRAQGHNNEDHRQLMFQLRQSVFVERQRNLNNMQVKSSKKGSKAKSSKSPKMGMRMSMEMVMGMNMMSNGNRNQRSIPNSIITQGGPKTGRMSDSSSQNGGGGGNGALTNSLITRAGAVPMKKMGTMNGANEGRIGSLFIRVP